MKKPGKSFFVSYRALQFSYRVILYILWGTAVSVCASGLLPPVAWLSVALFSILILCDIALVNVTEKAVTVYRFFRRPICLRWDDITHVGTVTKKAQNRNVAYIYFSSKRLITAPNESMPPMGPECIYFSYTPRVENALCWCWRNKNIPKPRIPDDAYNQRTMPVYNLFYVCGIYFFLLFYILHRFTGSNIWFRLELLPVISAMIGAAISRGIR